MSDTFPGQDIDLSFLNEIADGSNEFIIESIDMFLQQTPEILQSISESISTKDWGTTASAAHKLKPNLGFFGMPISQAIMQDIELMAKTGAPDAALLSAKFDEAHQLISVNLTALLRIKEEKEAES
ncbi:MAG TPA: Hpt domain-containing protein [Mucilaginibacter sp.]|jgi:HPt (histidine-containing phosphotransfer) domain-containing protein